MVGSLSFVSYYIIYITNGFQQLLGTICNQVWVVLVIIWLDYSFILLPICTEYFTNEEAIRVY